MDGRVLLFRARERLCAVPLALVVETMRPLAIDSAERRSAHFVLGLTVVRGVPLPVVDAGALLGAPGAPSLSRFVVVKAGARQVALAVEEVVGIRDVPPASMTALPALARSADAANIRALATLDSELLVVLEASRILPDGGMD